MKCLVYPEGAVNEDGADEPHCERHREVRGGVIHEVSNGLYRVHDDNDRYIDSAASLEEARAWLAEREEG